MKRSPAISILISMLIATLTSLPTRSSEFANDPALRTEAISIVKQFSSTLKPLLKEAIATGGLSHAIDICSIEAPQIAAQLSKESGWSVKRVSLKPRNSRRATADSFETKVLQEFDLRQQTGELPSTMTYTKATTNEFRFMKAQGTEGLCLNCHGKSISNEVRSALKQYYPNDVATGYSLGQVRGAFSLIKKFGKRLPQSTVVR